MLDFLDCSQENKALLRKLFLPLITLRQIAPEQLYKYMEPQTADMIYTLCQFNEPPNAKKLLLSICKTFCKFDINTLREMTYVREFVQSNLFIIIKKLYFLKILDTDTLDALLKQSNPKHFDEVIAFLYSNKICSISKKLVLHVMAVLKAHEQNPNAAQEYLQILSILKSLELLDIDTFILIGKLNLSYTQLVINYLTEAELLQKNFGKEYLQRVFFLEYSIHIPFILKICQPHLAGNLKDKQTFLLMLLNNPNYSREYVQAFLDCLNILNSNKYLNKNTIFKLLNVVNLIDFKLIFETISHLPKHVFNEETCTHLFEQFKNRFMSYDPSLAKFINFCDEHKLFNTEEGNENLFKIIEFAKRNNIFESIIKNFQFNGNFDQVKLNLLLIKQETYETIEQIEFLEKNHLLAYFDQRKIIKLLERKDKEINLSALFNSINILTQAFEFNKSEIFLYFNLLVQSNKPEDLAKAFIELQRHPIFLSKTTKTALHFKHLYTSANPLELLVIFKCLEKNNLLTEDILELIPKEPNEKLAALTSLINDISLTTEELAELLSLIILDKSHNPVNFIKGILHLKQQGIYSQAFKTLNISKILNHTNPLDLCIGLALIHQALLSKEKKDWYTESCFLYGANLFSINKPIEKLSAEQRTRIKNGYVINSNRLYLSYNGAFSHLADITATQLKFAEKRIFETSSAEKYLLKSHDIRHFLDLLEIPNKIISCENFARCVLTLEENLLITTHFVANFYKRVLAQSNPHEAAQALGLIKLSGLLNTHIDYILNHPNPLSLAQTLNFMTITPLTGFELTLKDKILSHPKPYEFLQALQQLIQKEIYLKDLFKSNIQIFITHHEPMKFAKCILSLHDAGILDFLLPIKKFFIALSSKTTNLEIFTKAIIRLYEQNSLSANEVNQFQVFFLENSYNDDFEKLLKKLLELPLDMVVVGHNLLKKISDKKNIFLKKPKLLDEISQLVSHESLKLFRQSIFESLLENPNKNEHIIESLEYLIKNDLVT